MNWEEWIEQILIRLKELRYENEVNPMTLAVVLGKHSKTGYYDIESGRTKLTVTNLAKLATFYGLSVQYFFDLKNTEMVQKEKTA